MMSSFFFFFNFLQKSLISVKTSEKSGIVFFLKADNLACYNFSDAGRKQETAGSETKDVYYSTAGSMSLLFISSSLFPSSVGVIGSRPSR